MMDGPSALTGDGPAFVTPSAAPSATSSATPPTAPADAGPAGLPPDIARLFRRSLALGRMHPLLPLLLRYRHGAAPPPSDAEVAP